MPSFDAILFYCIDSILHLDSGKKTTERKKLSQKKNELKIFMICCYSDGCRLQQHLFYYALYESSATKLYRIGNISVFPLSFVWFYCLRMSLRDSKRQKNKSSARTMIIIFCCCCNKRSIFFLLSFIAYFQCLHFQKKNNE